MDRSNGQFIELSNHLYARAVALGATRAERILGVSELVAMAGGNPHLLGRARERLSSVALEHPESPHVRHGLELLTSAWITAIQATDDASVAGVAPSLA